MARMPAATWVGEQSPRTPMSRYDIVCIHTIVGFAPAHAAHFSVKADGTILQSRDTAFRSAANLDGNHRVIAIENEDHGGPFSDWNVNDGHAVPGFTDDQVEAIAKILKWAHETHGIPLQLAPNSRPESRGLAYHRQGIDGNFTEANGYEFPGRVSGGEVWTSSPGKVCPGDRRIAARPRILDLAKGDDMPDLQEIANAVWAVKIGEKGDEVSARVRLRGASEGVVRLEKSVKDHREGTWARERVLLKIARAQSEMIEALTKAVADDATRTQVANGVKSIKAELDLLAATLAEIQGEETP